jgi:hypothetical protein
MSIWNFLTSWFGAGVGVSTIGSFEGSSDNNSASSCSCSSINPATGLPMIDDCGGNDVGGSPFGTDIHHFDDSWSTSGIEISDDSYLDASASWGDTFGND